MITREQSPFYMEFKKWLETTNHITTSDPARLPGAQLHVPPYQTRSKRPTQTRTATQPGDSHSTTGGQAPHGTMNLRLFRKGQSWSLDRTRCRSPCQGCKDDDADQTAEINDKDQVKPTGNGSRHSKKTSDFCQTQTPAAGSPVTIRFTTTPGPCFSPGHCFSKEEIDRVVSLSNAARPKSRSIRQQLAAICRRGRPRRKRRSYFSTARQLRQAKYYRERDHLERLLQTDTNLTFSA